MLTVGIRSQHFHVLPHQAPARKNPPAGLLFLHRYIDDLVGATTLAAEDIPALFGPIGPDGYSVTDEAIKLSFVIPAPGEELPALDVLIGLENGKPKVRLYRKPTDGHQYLHWTSAHPLHTRASIPFSQLVRVARNCSDLQDTVVVRDELLARFRSRGYPEWILNAAATRLDNLLATKSRHQLLRPIQKPTPPEVAFITTFNPAAAPRIARTAEAFWIRLQSNPPIHVSLRPPDGSPCFPHRLQFIYRAGRSLGSHLGRPLKRGPTASD